MTVSRNKDLMNSTIRRFALAFVVTVLLVGALSVSTYADGIVNYQITGPGPTGTYTASFTLPQNPTPSAGDPLVFDFASLPVDVNGTWTDLTVVFDSSLLGGGVIAINGFVLFGPQLFSWSSSSSTPTMDTGVFQLSGATGSGVGTYILTVTDPPVAASEPSSTLLLGVSALLLFGVNLLRRFA